MTRLTKALLVASAILVSTSSFAGIEEGIKYLEQQKYELAKKEFQKDAAKDIGDAYYWLGKMSFEGLGGAKQRLTGIGLWERASYLGSVKAQLAVANAFRLGLGVNPEPRQAYVWDLEAAKAGSPIGMKNVGDYYLTGNSKPKDTTEAAKWYTKSVALGYPPAMIALAKLLQNGDGVNRDRVAAYVLYLAADKPSAEFEADRNAKANARILKHNMTEEEVVRASNLTVADVVKSLDALNNHKPE